MLVYQLSETLRITATDCAKSFLLSFELVERRQTTRAEQQPHHDQRHPARSMSMGFHLTRVLMRPFPLTYLKLPWNECAITQANSC